MSGIPHAKWLAMLRSRRCAAKRRDQQACQSPAMSNGRCRMHGGKSTGPRTPEGLQAIRRANTRHGLRSAAFLAERKEAAASMRFIRQMLASLRKIGGIFDSTRLHEIKHDGCIVVCNME